MEKRSSYLEFDTSTGNKEKSKWDGKGTQTSTQQDIDQSVDILKKELRTDVCKYRPEVGKIKFLDYPRYSSYENINLSFIG